MGVPQRITKQSQTRDRVIDLIETLAHRSAPRGLHFRNNKLQHPFDCGFAAVGLFMFFDEFERERRFRHAWESVQIERSVPYSLFTFGESVLPYYLVCGASAPGGTVSIRQGEVRITRPTIITPDTMRPEFLNFFEDRDDEEMVDFLLARSAAFSHLKLSNESGSERIVSDSVEEAVARLNRQLDDDEEDRVAILSAPPGLAGVAVLRYAAESVLASAPDNVQELRERGFLP
jgi:hypothetical protein